MNEFAQAYLIGLSMALHPCSLLTTLSAIQLLLNLSLGTSKNTFAPYVFIGGYAATLIGFGCVVLLGLMQSHTLSHLMRDLSTFLFGPILIVIGMLYTGLIDLSFNPAWINNFKLRRLGGAFTLGLLLAMSLCPATAMLFFGIFVPKALHSHHPLLMLIPFCCGALTCLSAIALVFHHGGQALLKHQRYAQKIGLYSGSSLIVIGIYLSLKNIYFK